MQSTGIVNDHLVGCAARAPCEEARRKRSAGQRLLDRADESSLSGSTIGEKRAMISPSRPTRNFSKFQRMSPVWPSASATGVSCWYSAWRPSPLTSIFSVSGNCHAVAGAAERLDLVGRARLLRAELVARDADDREALRAEALVQLLEALVLRRQAAERRDVDEQRDLALLLGEHAGLAVERVERNRRTRTSALPLSSKCGRDYVVARAPCDPSAQELLEELDAAEVLARGRRPLRCRRGRCAAAATSIPCRRSRSPQTHE